MICETCQTELVATSKDWLICPKCMGRLYPNESVKGRRAAESYENWLRSLPTATRVGRCNVSYRPMMVWKIEGFDSPFICDHYRSDATESTRCRDCEVVANAGRRMPRKFVRADLTIEQLVKFGFRRDT